MRVMRQMGVNKNYLTPTLKGVLAWKTFHIKMNLIFMKKKESCGGTHFHINGFGKKNRFDTEANLSPEMA